MAAAKDAVKAKLKEIAKVKSKITKKKRKVTKKKRVVRTRRKKIARKRKTGRTSHYITGTYDAVKCKEPVKYRSSWELTVAQHLDDDPTVESFEYETIIIPYITSRTSMRIRKYIPDFIVKYSDGRTVIIEVKRQSALNQRTIMVKAEAARKFAATKGWEYVFWTENIVMKLRKIQEAKEKLSLASISAQPAQL